MIEWQFKQTNEIFMMKKILEIKINTVTEIKNNFDGLINSLGTAEKRFSSLRMSIETSKTEKRKKKKRQNILKLWDKHERYNI